MVPLGMRAGYLTYTINVTNPGPNAATNVVVTDVLPSQVQYISLTLLQTGGCTYATATRTFRCTLSRLAIGATWKITIHVKWVGGDKSANCATVRSAAYELNSLNNRACVTHNAMGQVVARSARPALAWADALVAWLKRQGV